MKHTTPLLALLLFATPVLAQQDDPELNPYATPPTVDEDETDRPLARALAFNRRDFVEDLLLRPDQLSAREVQNLAKDLSIRTKHAGYAVEAARAGVDVSDLSRLLERGLPKDFKAPEDLSVLKTATQQRLVELGMSETQAKGFLRWRRSARRVAIHAGEVKTIRELRIKGEAATAETTRKILRGNGFQRVQAIAQAIGLFAPEATEARTAAELQERKARATRDAMEPMRPDPLIQHRNKDGTLNWKSISKGEAARAANGVLHFAFSLFLKELVVVLRTGDQARLNEFLDGLLTTDFYVNYGLFAIGARTADGMYGQYARRLAKKRFVNGVVRSNLVLAAGLAVPMIVRGHFSLDTYVVDVAALGLSATAVKAAIEGTKGVYRLVSKNKAIRLGKLATPAGWVFTAAETAVVLLIGDAIADKIDGYLDEKQLRDAINDSKGDLWRLMKAVEDGEDISEAEIVAAVLAVESAYDRLREHKTDPLKGRLASFQKEMDSIARLAMRGEAQAEAMERALGNNPALRAYFANRHGSVENYLGSLRRDTSEKAEEQLVQQNDDFEAEWNALIKGVYEGETTEADPIPTEGSRLATYDDQTEALLAIMDSTTDPEAREHIALAIARVRMSRQMDRSVYESGNGGGSTNAPSSGMTQALPSGQ
jgi:hypothetical protein